MKEGEREADLPKRVLTEEETNTLLPRTLLFLQTSLATIGAFYSNRFSHKNEVSLYIFTLKKALKTEKPSPVDIEKVFNCRGGRIRTCHPHFYH